MIGLIRDRFADIPAAPGTEGIGDDCAVIPLPGGEALLVTTDLLAEEVHFRLDTISPFELGRKALAVNLSDIAATGGMPWASFLSLSFPESTDTAWIEEFLEGYKTLSKTFGVPLLGGDTTASSGPVVINVTVIGRMPYDDLKRRSGARPGDRIFVTGYLGDSAQGLLDIREGRGESGFAAIHRNPRPYVNEGIWLGRQKAVHAMMDISDGLASDLTHIARASGVTARVDLERIPTHTRIELAVTGGEDYQLLLTVAPESAAVLIEKYRREFGETLHEIGTVESGEATIRWIENGIQIFPTWKGFTHFQGLSF